MDEMRTEGEGLGKARGAADQVLANQLRSDVELLATALGERHDGSAAAHARLTQAADYLERELGWAGAVRRSEVAWRRRFGLAIHPGARPVENLEARIEGASADDGEVIVGAHYDSVRGGPGADDNASGIAVLLAVGRALARSQRSRRRSVRLVAFANEERPHTRRRSMGSLAYASALRASGGRVAAMVSLECLGFFAPPRDEGLRLPLRVLARRRAPADNVMLVANVASRALLAPMRAAFEAACTIPLRAAALPGALPVVSASDHWAFWKQGWRAVMLTDMAPVRYRHYHRRTDIPAHLDYAKMAALVPGVVAMIDRLSDEAEL